MQAVLKRPDARAATLGGKRCPRPRNAALLVEETTVGEKRLHLRCHGADERRCRSDQEHGPYWICARTTR
jgi:hypothetical protein